MKKTSIPIAAEVAQILDGKADHIQSSVNDTADQLDGDRSKLDQILVKTGTTALQLESLLENLADFRKIFKQVAKDSIKEEVAKAVQIELNKIRLENPDKVIIIYKSFWSSLAFWRK